MLFGRFGGFVVVFDFVDVLVFGVGLVFLEGLVKVVEDVFVDFVGFLGVGYGDDVVWVGCVYEVDCVVFIFCFFVVVV